MDRKAWSKEVVTIHSPDDLREITRGSDLEIVQFKPGRLRGSITHFALGNLGVSLGRFSSETRVRGTLHPERVVLGTMFDCAGPVTQWWKDMRPGDVTVFPALGEVDAIHSGGAAFLTASIALPELLSNLGGEEHLADPAFWNKKRLYNTNPRVGAEMLRRLKGIVSSVEQRSTAPSDQSVAFLQHSVIEPFVVGLTSVLPPTSARSYTGARLVKETEDYLNAAGEGPVHISELCNALRVSRRSLHRAFADTLGIGPVAYLRRRRLSALQSILKRSDPATTSIGDLAFEYGFPEAGRFASYYRSYFGETPSETLRSGTASARSLR